MTQLLPRTESLSHTTAIPDPPKPGFPSPFLPDSQIQYAWDSTSLGLLKACPRKYYLTMIEGWRKRDESMHLTFGIAYHKGLERYDIFRTQGSDHHEALIKVVQQCLCESGDRVLDEQGVEVWQPWETGNTKKNRETLVRSIIWYLEEYKNDAARTLVLANGKPAVELSFRFDTGIHLGQGKNYILSGHMDRLVEFGGTHYVMDRKTTGSTLSGYYFDGYSPDNQMTLYTLASRIVYDMPVAGVIIDAAQVAVGFTAFSRGITMRTELQLDEWLEGFSDWMTTAAYYAEVQRWPMNEMSCNNYGACQFRGVCNKDPRVRQSFLANDFHKVPWNPLEER